MRAYTFGQSPLAPESPSFFSRLLATLLSGKNSQKSLYVSSSLPIIMGLPRQYGFNSRGLFSQVFRRTGGSQLQESPDISKYMYIYRDINNHSYRADPFLQGIIGHYGVLPAIRSMNLLGRGLQKQAEKECRGILYYDRSEFGRELSLMCFRRARRKLSQQSRSID